MIVIRDWTEVQYHSPGECTWNFPGAFGGQIALELNKISRTIIISTLRGFQGFTKPLCTFFAYFEVKYRRKNKHNYVPSLGPHRELNSEQYETKPARMFN